MQRQLEAFLQALGEEQGRTENTLAAYRRDLIQYTGFLNAQAHCTSWRDVSDIDVMNYFFWLKDKGSAPATMTRKAAAVRGLHRFLLRTHESDRDPSYGIELPKVTHEQAEILSADDVKKLIEAPDVRTRTGIRDRAMIEVLYATGVRVSELIRLNVDDLNLEMGFVRCRGKKGTERIIPLGQAAREACRTYFEKVRTAFPPETAQDALFLNRSGHRMTRQGFWKLIKKYARETPIDVSLSPETLRQTFAAHMLENGADIQSVEELLGHTSSAETRRYRLNRKRRLRDVYARFHPRA